MPTEEANNNNNTTTTGKPADHTASSDPLSSIRRATCISFDASSPTLASKKNSVNTACDPTTRQQTQNEKKQHLSEEMRDSPSIQAISNLRCPSPPPILQHPNPISMKSTDSFLLTNNSNSNSNTNNKSTSEMNYNSPLSPSSPLALMKEDDSIPLEIDSPPPILIHNHKETIPAGGALLRGTVAQQAIAAAVAAQTAREKLSSPLQRNANVTPVSSSKLTESLKQVNSGKTSPTTTNTTASTTGLESPHHRAPSMHAHFYVEDILKHPAVRSRSGSASTNETRIISDILNSPILPDGGANYNNDPMQSSAIIGTGATAGATAGASNVDSRLPQDDGKLHILFGACGSISIKKTRLIINKLEEIYKDKVSIQLILTKAAEHFVSREEFPSNVQIWRDKDEWTTWSNRTDPVLHIELRRWADILIIAPMTANTLSKIALGLCDNLLTNVVRAWNTQYPVLMAPAMVSFAYTSVVTKRHAKSIKEEMKWIEILKPTEKVVGSYGEIGMGGMMDWNEVVDRIVQKLGGYPEEEDEDDRDPNADGDDDEDDEDDDEDNDFERDGDNDNNDDDEEDEDDDTSLKVRKLTVAEED